jgi:NADH-quinone oxidoreductase subunit M
MVGFIYERRHTRLITEFGGLWSIVPIYSAIFMLVMLSSIGLPGLNGFVGEFLILLGAFHANPWAGGLATLGVVLGAVYMLTMYKRVIFGPVTVEANRALHDLSGREVAVMVPILVLIIWLGVYPKPFLDRIEPSARAVLARVDRPVATSRVATAEVRP